MSASDRVKIISFYEFRDLTVLGPLHDTRAALRQALIDLDVRGTIIIANEGFNGMVCGAGSNIEAFVSRCEGIFGTTLKVKTSFHDKAPFRKVDIKIKPEIVTLKKDVNIALGVGTHVDPRAWNRLISDPGTIVLDARNDYEYTSGTFKGAINPHIARFSDLPAFVEKNLDPSEQKRVAMFCTGGIRCEKFAPYLKQIGFQEVYQLDGGILKYLEEVPQSELLWEGECFVFDERITVNANLEKGTGPDHSQRHKDKC